MKQTVHMSVRKMLSCIAAQAMTNQVMEVPLSKRLTSWSMERFLPLMTIRWLKPLP